MIESKNPHGIRSPPKNEWHCDVAIVDLTSNRLWILRTVSQSRYKPVTLDSESVRYDARSISSVGVSVA